MTPDTHLQVPFAPAQSQGPLLILVQYLLDLCYQGERILNSSNYPYRQAAVSEPVVKIY